MQGPLLAPFAWFATQKCQLGAPPSNGRVTLFFLFLQEARAGRCPSWGARQSTPQSPNPRVRLCAVLPSARGFARFAYRGLAMHCAMARERSWVCLGDTDERFREQGKSDHLLRGWQSCRLWVERGRGAESPIAAM